MAVHVGALNERPCAAPDQLGANSDLKSSDDAVAILGLIFLRCADHRFQPLTFHLRGVDEMV